MEVLRTPLGHVTMVPKGTYSSTTTYNRLDLVTYTDNDKLALYIAKEDNLSNVPPSTTTSWMKVIDSSDLQGPTGPQGEQGIQGETGNAAGFGLPTGTATVLNPGISPTISITSSGNNTEKVFKFDFGIPQGPTGPKGDKGDKGNTGNAAGFGLPTGSVTMLDPGSSPSITISPTGPNTAKIFDFNFNIPKGDTGPRGETGLSIVTNPIHLEFTNDQLDFGLFESSVGSGDSNVEFRITPSNQQVGVFITRYALPNSGQSLKRLTLLDTSGNSSFPGNLQVVGNLNLPYNPLTIENGGTGASTTTQARQNLEITPANIGALPINGGTITGQIYQDSKASRWDHGRDNAIIRKFDAGSAWGPAVTMMGLNGDWSIGKTASNTDDSLVFQYTPNAAYTNSTNETYKVYMPVVSSATNNYIFTGKAVPASQEPQVGSALATNTVILVYEE